MANQVLNEAFATKIKSGPKAVLIALSDMANADRVAYPSTFRLAAMSGISRSAVCKALVALVSGNHIRLIKRVCKKTNKNMTNLYIVRPQYDKDLYDELFKSSKNTQDFIDEVLQNSVDPCPESGHTLSEIRTTPALIQDINPHLTHIEPKKEKTRANALLSLEEYIQKQRDQGLDSVPASASCFELVEERGMPFDTVIASWQYLVETYCGDSTKRYRDWMLVLNNAINANWGNNWRFDSVSKTYTLSQMGLSRVHAFEVTQAQKNGSEE